MCFVYGVCKIVHAMSWILTWSVSLSSCPSIPQLASRSWIEQNAGIGRPQRGGGGVEILLRFYCRTPPPISASLNPAVHLPFPYFNESHLCLPTYSMETAICVGIRAFNALALRGSRVSYEYSHLKSKLFAVPLEG